jgi:hypothetical protein
VSARQLFPLLFVFSFAVPTFAQEESRKVRVDARRPLRLDYQSAAWNKDKEKVETSMLLIRDSKSGRSAQVEVTETGRDTGLFLGYYQLNFGEGQEPDMTPEIYVVPPSLAAGPDGAKNIGKMIREGQLLRKPYFLRLEERKQQAISVYDTKDQALEAYQGFLLTGTGRQIVDRAAIEAAQTARMSDEAKVRREAEAKAQAERRAMEQTEAMKKEEAMKKMAAMDENVKALRKSKAQTAATAALDLFKKEQYVQAEVKFQEAIESDPENQGLYFQYAVTLFKNENYTKSLVMLDLVKGTDVNPAELDYYRGLNHLKLQEYNNAYKRFLDVKNKNDIALSPAAGFFAGVIDFQNENYDSAKALFEYVLDNSKDPQVDQQSEAYLEQIANIRQFQQLQKTKFFVNAQLGFIYDSNILSISAANAPTDLAGLRWMYGGSLEYRPIYTQRHELSAQMAVNDMYSQDKALQAKTEFQNTDPLQAVFTLPYRWKAEAFGKAYQLSLVPGYENVQMNADGEGTRETILNSTVLNIDQTFVMSEDWFSTYTIELRRDTSLITAAAEDNQSASKISISSSQALFFDAKKTKALIWDLGYGTNNADGVNQKYRRLDTALTYLHPINDTWSGTTRLGLYNSAYNEHLTGRSDNNFGMTLAARRGIEKLLFFNVAFTYMKNNSIEAFTYDKYSLMTFLSWDQNF